MFLAPASHALLEEFFREYFHNENLMLPRVRVYAGRAAGVVTKTFGIGAITFGGRVLVAPRLLRRGPDGLLRAPGPLVAHEATHVLQYEREGYVRFLSRYLTEYAAALVRSKERGAARHWAAYRAISFEARAREAEAAFAAWQGERDVRGASSL